MSKKDNKDWMSEGLSENRVASYKPFVFVDGVGVRCSLYVSGCLFNCEGCFNKSIQDFSAGEVYTDELEATILEDLAQPYVDGLTLLGGEPFLNTQVCLRLVKAIRGMIELHDKTIWSWSGYTIEELLEGSEDKRELLSYLDVLVDGPFVLAERSLTTPFRGSSNQRVIDVPKSISAGYAVELEGYEKEATNE